MGFCELIVARRFGGVATRKTGGDRVDRSFDPDDRLRHVGIDFSVVRRTIRQTSATGSASK